MSHAPIRIATRKSPLALWQAEFVRDSLLRANPGLQVELIKMTTQGDKILDTPLAKVGGKGLFVKELEQGMLRGEAPGRAFHERRAGRTSRRAASGRDLRT